MVVHALALLRSRVCPAARTTARPRPRGRRARSSRRQAVSGASLTRTTSRKLGSSFRRCRPSAPERAALRSKLLHYLLDPVLALNPTTLKREVRDLDNDDVYDVIFDSFRDALALYDPAELWSVPPRIPEADQRMLRPAARAGRRPVLAARRRRAGDARARRARHDGPRRGRLARPARSGGALDRRGERARRAAGRAGAPAPIDVLEGALGDWPAPAVVERARRPLPGAAAARRVRRCASPGQRRFGARARWASCCSRTATRSSARSSAWPASTCAPA